MVVGFTFAAEVTTEVPEKVTTTTEKVKPTTIKAETPKPTTVKTEEAEEPDYYEEIDATPVTKKPLSAADKQWIQNILSRTTKATTTTPTTTTVQTTASAVQHLTTETSSVSANSCPTKCWTAGTATVCSSATCRDPETVLRSTTTAVLCSASATICSAPTAAVRTSTTAICSASTTATVRPASAAVQTTATTTTRPIKCPAPTGNQ